MQEEMTNEQKKKRKRATFNLPEQGIVNERGVLFHHTAPRRLCQLGVERLAEAGIIVKTNHFEKTKDDILKKNWSVFADEYGLDNEYALHLAGQQAKARGVDERLIFIRKTGFYEKMCNGLRERACEKVMWRMRALFDPNRQEQDGNMWAPFTEDQDKLLKRLYQGGFTSSKIGKQMKKPLARIISRIKYFQRQGLTRQKQSVDSVADSEYTWSYSFTKNNQKLKGYEMPETGVLNEQGHFFHHVTGPRYLSFENIKRLQEHGIYIERSKFQPEEHEKILANWKEFAEKHQINDLLASWFVGMGMDIFSKEVLRRPEFGFYVEDPRFDGWDTQDRMIYHREHNFWPILCRGLQNRTARSIGYHLAKRMDPMNLIPGANDPMTEEQLEELDRTYRMVRSLTKVAIRLNRPYHFVLGAISIQKRRTFPLQLFERRRLWNLIEKKYGQQTKEIVLEEIEDGVRKVNLKLLACLISRNTRTIEHEWKRIVKEFKGHLITTSYEEALKAIIPEPYLITGREFSDFVELLIAYNPQMKLRHMKLRLEDRLKLERAMLRMGLTGFRTNACTELAYCLRTLRFAVKKICITLKPIADLSQLSRTDILKSISRSFRKAQDNPCRSLRTADFVRILIEQLSNNNSEWKPPKRLLSWLGKQKE